MRRRSGRRQPGKVRSFAGIDADRIEKLAADKFVANDRIVSGLDILLEDNRAVASGIETVAFNKAFKLLRLF